MWSYLGLFTSQCLIEFLGAAFMTTVADPLFQTAYDQSGLGGLIGQAFEGYGSGVRGFGKFIQVIISFSTVAVVITNVYSLGLSAQVMGRWAIKIPRLVWSGVGAIIFIVCAVAGRDHLEVVMEDFLLILAYWLTPFVAVLGVEHFLFRRKRGYNPLSWNQQKELPYGIAASIAWAVGTTLSFLCMSQAWAVGPIALAVGGGAEVNPFGIDISWELSLGATILLYIPMRWYELKKTGL